VSTQLSCGDVASAVQAKPARLGRTRLVAIDGPAGSGKSTLAAVLQRMLPHSCVVHMDDAYLGWETDFTEVHSRLRTQLIEPLAAGRGGRFQRYDWHLERLADWIDVPVPDVLLLEGVASGGRALDDVRSLLVWVEVPAVERVRRGVARDGPGVLAKWLAWMEHEDAEHRVQDTRARADLRLLATGVSQSFTLLASP
jgi:energy-coupling factor transporter ATP-binding protein EcfA2